MALRDIQSNIQKAKAARDKQLVASTTATQSGSTSTPTTTETPKVVQPVKTQDVAQQRIQSNISNIKNIRSAEVSNIPDLFDKQSEEPYQSHLSKWFGREPGEKTQGAITNLFDKLRPAAKKITEVGGDIAATSTIAKQERQEDTKDFEKRYTPEGLKQYFNYYEDKLGESVRPAVGRAGYRIVRDIQGITQFINNTINDLGQYVPDQGLLVRKGILPASQTAEELAISKQEAESKRAEIIASVIDTALAMEEWMDTTERGREAKEYEGISLLDALEKRDTKAVRNLFGTNVGDMLPGIAAGAAGGKLPMAGEIFSSQYLDTLEDYMNDPDISANRTEDEIHRIATLSAAIQTAIEVWSLEEQVFNPMRKSSISKKITQPVVSRVLGQWLKGSFSEMVEEITQQTAEDAFAMLLGSNRGFLSRDDYADIGLEAFLIGLVASGPGAVVNGVSTKRQQNIYNENIVKIRREVPGLTEDEAKEILNAVIDYEEKKEDITKLENKVTKLYDNKQNIQTRIDELQQNPTDQNKYQIQLLEKKIQDIDESISKVDKKINDMYQPMQDVNDRLNKDVPTQEDIEQTVKTNYENMRQSELDRMKAGLIPGQQSNQIQGGENLSEQTMVEPDRASVLVSQKVGTRDKGLMRADFKRSVQQIQSGKDYTNTPFAKYAYGSSGQSMRGNQKQRDQMIEKVKSLLDGIGIDFAFTSRGREVLGNGVVGQYRQGENAVIYRRGINEMIVYGHEVFHAMMDVIMNGKLTDKNLQSQLQLDLTRALMDVKKQFGLDGLTSTTDINYANIFAEEWLANAFGEYLAKRELTGPKTFRQRISNFFDRIINAFSLIFKKDKALKPELERAFESIAKGDVRGYKSNNGFVGDYLQRGDIRKGILGNIGESTDESTFKGYKAENGGNISESTKEELNNMREEYNELENELKNNDLTEEEKAEYNTDIDGINQNANMLADLGEEYTDFTSKKISSEGIEDADEATQSNESDMGETRQEISEEDGQLEADEELQNETTEEELNKQEEPEKEKVNTFKEDYEAYLKEKDRQKKGEFKENSKECRRDIWTVAKNILTPTMTRIYNINKRIAGRLTQMETQTGINIYRYTQKTQGFADTFNGLSKGQQLEASKALFNFGALAKEQTEETLQEYKDNEKKKLRDVLTKNGFKDEDIDNLFEVLNDLGTRYKEAGMDITVTDMYFPRTVSDYKGLIRYLNEHSETPIQGKNARTIYNEIKKITEDPTLSDVQKESEIRRKLSENFSPKVSTKTKYSEERQLGLLSDWGAGIYAYYENPVESLASYITSMEQAIQRQLFLGGMKDTQGIDIDIKGQSSDQSVSAIVRDMFEKGQITESQINELHTCIMAVLNKKGTPRWVRAIKDITYTMALTNYISAMNQAEDIGVAIIENKKGLISVLKSIFTKAGIKYDEAGLESAYEMFKTNSKPSDWLFRKSGFNAIDRAGKRSFINAAWNSMVQTYKNPKARGHMYERLKAMYGDKTANHIMDCVRNNNYMVGKKGNQQIDIDVLTDLLYQLGNTQPIYQSSMPVSYLEHPGVRWLYSLSMFSLRQIDHIIQSTKSAYEEGGVANAAYVGFKLITARMFFNALIGGVTSLLQGDLDDSWIWKLFEGDWEGAGKLFGGDMLKGFLKMWMFSKYDWKVRKNEGLWAFATNRISPYILQEGFKGRRAVQKALKNDDRKELMTMMRDVPLLGKQAYGRWKYYQDNILVDPFDKAFDDAFDQAFDGAFDEAFDNAFDEAFDKSFDKSFDKAFK